MVDRGDSDTAELGRKDAPGAAIPALPRNNPVLCHPAAVGAMEPAMKDAAVCPLAYGLASWEPCGACVYGELGVAVQPAVVQGSQATEEPERTVVGQQDCPD